MSDVFISYSRQNIDFARRLASEFRRHDFEVWIDLEGIRFTSDWWEEIKTGIERAGNFLLIMSEHTLSSPVCHLEIEYARELNKRIILLDHDVFDRKTSSTKMLDRLVNDSYVNTLLGDRNPMILFDKNWHVIEKYQRIKFRYINNSQSNQTISNQSIEFKLFNKQFDNLLSAIRTDLGHVNTHTRLLIRTHNWKSSGSNSDYLLYGKELEQAEDWLQKYDNDYGMENTVSDITKLPAPNDNQRKYIAKSRLLEDERHELAEKGQIELKRNQRRSQYAILTLGIVTIIGFLVVIFTVVLTNSRIVQANDEVATADAGIEIANTTLMTLSVELTDTYDDLIEVSAERATAIALDNQTETLMSNTQRIFGPVDGILEHNADNMRIELINDNVQVRDGVFYSRFYNPYSVDIGPWDIGFIFRSTTDAHYRISIQSDGTWRLSLFSNLELEIVQSGVVDNLRVDDGDYNDFRIIANGSIGRLIVNEREIDTLDLSTYEFPGTITLGVGFIHGNLVNGLATRYEDFTVWAIVEQN